MTDEHVAIDSEGGIASYMREKGVSGNCPACGQDAGWLRYTSKYGDVSIPVMTPDGQPLIIGGGALPTVALSCNNCGYIMLFDMRRYREWEKDNGGKPE